MYIAAVLSVILLVVIDQLTKYLAVVFLMPVGTVKVLEGFIHFTYVENEGAAFGLMQGGRWIFVVMTVIVIVFICIYYARLPKGKKYRWEKISLVLISAGAVGNFIDRLLYGKVVDFMQFAFINFPVFNFADICVVIGTALLAILLIFFDKQEKEEQEEKEAAEVGSDEDND